MTSRTRQGSDQTQATIDHLKAGRCSVSDTRSLLAHPSVLVRANAVEALARLAPQQPDVIADLVRVAQEPGSAARMIGVRLGYVAVASLLRTGLPEAVTAARQLLAAWPEQDKDDLLWYLAAERLWERPAPTAGTRAATSAA